MSWLFWGLERLAHVVIRVGEGLERLAHVVRTSFQVPERRGARGLGLAERWKGVRGGLLLWVARGLGLGKALVDAAVTVAERIGYREIRLDTLPTMDEAIRLYAKLGFEPISPYYVTPIEGTRFMAKRLNPSTP